MATYAEVADTEKVAKATLMTILLTLSSKMLEERKKQIKKEDEVKKELEVKMFFFRCWSVESGQI